jgi:hypothetical protein
MSVILRLRSTLVDHLIGVVVAAAVIVDSTVAFDQRFAVDSVVVGSVDPIAAASFVVARVLFVDSTAADFATDSTVADFATGSTVADFATGSTVADFATGSTAASSTVTGFTGFVVVIVATDFAVAVVSQRDSRNLSWHHQDQFGLAD